MLKIEKSVDVEGTILKTTDKAILFLTEEITVWIPRSQIINTVNEDLVTGSEITIEIPNWLAVDKELI